ncbi:MAG: hypothetical protein HN411_06665 [Waddliaceae bacterium]|jgi:hypothetical protein|nr:hypothetical protein [Waddliaceae bacterium]MBT3578437.1 hypothetical protein [Waddliaceae bacterium]MBT4445112.1 hypothetical protein [Waddliaceae bacterium]MBT6928200.1 hypothetical protein [Waddliaceae bacterium]MBT7264611.1 hypothetical protein [Waddliaceae bacterium]
MKITEKILSIPPYISVSWHDITAVHVEGDKKDSPRVVIIILIDGSRVEIPDLSDDIIDTIFDIHASYLEHEPENGSLLDPDSQEFQDKLSDAFTQASDLMKWSGGDVENQGPIPGEIPMQFGMGGNIDGMGDILHHNPEYANAPSLPDEILTKISAISSIIADDTDIYESLSAVDGCNCIHCQIVRAMRGDVEELDEEEVSDEDLKFREWDISQIGEKLYEVSNPLDSTEHYNVYLGEPMGCTCGKKNCEHLRAVLET